MSGRLSPSRNSSEDSDGINRSASFGGGMTTNEDGVDVWRFSFAVSELWTDNGNQTSVVANGSDAESRLPRLMENTEYAVGITELVVFSFGTPINLLVLYLACGILTRRRRKQNCHWLVLTMTAFDLLFCLVHAPMMFAQLIWQSPFSIGLCSFMHFCTHASATGSSLSLLLLNLDKFVHLYKPLHYPSLVTKRKTVAASILVSLLSFSWASFLMFGPFMTRTVSDSGQCANRIVATGVYVFLALKFFILPTLASLAISIFTAVVVVRSRSSALISKKTKGDECRSGQNGTSETELVVAKRNCARSPSPKHVHRESQKSVTNRAVASNKNTFCSYFKIIGFVFTTTLWSSITCLPYRISYLWYVTRITPPTPLEHFRMFAMFSLMILNPAGNPLVTCLTQHHYTEGVRKLIRRCKRLLLPESTSAGDRSLSTNNKLGAKTKSTNCANQTTTSKGKDVDRESNAFLQNNVVGKESTIGGQTRMKLSPVQRLESKKYRRKV